MTSYILPSQQFAQESQWRGIEHETRAMERTVDVPFQQLQSMQQMHMRSKELEAQLQTWEMQRQIQQRKLQEMMAVDAAEAGRLQNEALKAGVSFQNAQTEALRYETEQARSRAGRLSPLEQRLEDLGRHMPVPGSDEWFRGGYKMDESGVTTLMDVESPEYRTRMEEYERSVKATQRAPMSSTSRDAIALQKHIDNLTEQIQTITGPEWLRDEPLTPAQKLQLEALDKERKKAQAALRALLPGMGDEGAVEAADPTKPKSLFDIIDEEVERIGR